jgi:pleiotropic regulator 1
MSTDTAEVKIQESLKRTYQMFKNTPYTPYSDQASQKIKISTKFQDEYSKVVERKKKEELIIEDVKEDEISQIITKTHLEKQKKKETEQTSKSLVVRTEFTQENENPKDRALTLIDQRRRLEEGLKPEWHAPWKLMRVISGHVGHVRALAVDPSNEWFISGSVDRTIKIFDLASGTLKLTLTGHASTVRGLAISHKRPYFFSVAEDKTVKCWDLEVNKCIKHYHGHLSAVYCVALHPTLDLLVTGGRDASVRLWDIRTKKQVHLLTGHDSTVCSVVAQGLEPQVISGSTDSTVRLWDIVAGKSRTTLTNHKKSVRSLAIHPSEYTFASAAPDHIKKWKSPDGNFLQNFNGHHTLLNSISINNDNVLFSGANDGTMHFWDWKTGYNFQKTKAIPQPGSLDSESGIYCSTFDMSGSRLITGEADKSIKIWKEDPDATPESHPVDYIPEKNPKKY